MDSKTEQEAFWSGEFGDSYTERNQGSEAVASGISFFSTIVSAMDSKVESILELGANRGINLMALRSLLPHASINAVEINHGAYRILEENFPDALIENASILEWEPDDAYDLVLIKTVLIHINPDFLQQVYEKMWRSSKKYIVIAEYYNPTPTEVIYRGHEERLFKRDFAGEFLDRYPDCRLMEYGFVYHRDVHFPQDDINWFLIEKTV